MIHVIEEAFDVGFDDVAIPFELKIEHQAVYRLMGTLVGPATLAPASLYPLHPCRGHKFLEPLFTHATV